MIEITTLHAIAETMASLDFSEASQARLREQFAPLRLTFCLEDEMGMAEPYRECGAFNLYLVYSEGHCMSLTDQPEQAAGVVLAEVGE